jgi:hypothetical protein
MRGGGPRVLLTFIASACLSCPAPAQGPTPAAPPPTAPTAPPAGHLAGTTEGGVDGGVPPWCLCLTAEFLYLRPNREGLGLAVASTARDGSTFSRLDHTAVDHTAFSSCFRPCYGQVRCLVATLRSPLNRCRRRPGNAYGAGILFAPH